MFCLYAESLGWVSDPTGCFPPSATLVGKAIREAHVTPGTRLHTLQSEVARHAKQTCDPLWPALVHYQIPWPLCSPSSRRYRS